MLTAVSLPYRVGARLAALPRVVGSRSVHFPPFPVLSVGSLSFGGGGKAPLVLSLAEVARSKGLRPWVALRGYGAPAPAAPGFWAPGDRVDGLWRGLGDEALLYLGRGIPVVVGPDRRAALAGALERAAAPDLLLLDDGFGVRALGRDLDILVGAHAQRDFSFVGSRADLHLRVRHRATHLSRLFGTPAPLSLVRGRPLIALSGVARPERFHDLLAEQGGLMVASLVQRDHALPTQRLVRRIERLRRLHPEACVVTTEKDAVRWGDVLPAESLVLVTEAVVDGGPAPEVLLQRALDRAAVRLSGSAAGGL